MSSCVMASSSCFRAAFIATVLQSSSPPTTTLGLRVGVGQQRAWPKRSVQPYVYDPYKTVDFPPLLQGDEVIPEVAAPPSPRDGRINVMLNNDIIKRLDLSPIQEALKDYLPYLCEEHHNRANGEDGADCIKELMEKTVGFSIKYEREDPYDVRELSEMSDIRLWFIRVDAAYPWLPLVLDWNAGELAQYAAMLVPHQVSKRLGIVFNPDALELFAMKKLFITYRWLQVCKVQAAAVKVNDMLQVLGFKAEDDFLRVLEAPNELL